MATKQKKTNGKRRKPSVDGRYRQPLAVALSVWKTAMSLPPCQANSKKKEAVGWATLAARQAAEEEVEMGGDLAECLRAAAQVLLDQADKLESGDGL